MQNNKSERPKTNADTPNIVLYDTIIYEDYIPKPRAAVAAIVPKIQSKPRVRPEPLKELIEDYIKVPSALSDCPKKPTTPFVFMFDAKASNQEVVWNFEVNTNVMQIEPVALAPVVEEDEEHEEIAEVHHSLADEHELMFHMQDITPSSSLNQVKHQSVSVELATCAYVPGFNGKKNEAPPKSRARRKSKASVSPCGSLDNSSDNSEGVFISNKNKNRRD